jgi:hypothetical protein
MTTITTKYTVGQMSDDSYAIYYQNPPVMSNSPQKVQLSEGM